MSRTVTIRGTLIIKNIQIAQQAIQECQQESINVRGRTQTFISHYPQTNIRIQNQRFVYQGYDYYDGLNKQREIQRLEEKYNSLLQEHYRKIEAEKRRIEEEKRRLEEQIAREKEAAEKRRLEQIAKEKAEAELKRLQEIQRIEEEKRRIEEEKRKLREEKKEKIIQQAKKQGYQVKQEVTKDNKIQLVLQKRVY